MNHLKKKKKKILKPAFIEIVSAGFCPRPAYITHPRSTSSTFLESKLIDLAASLMTVASEVKI